jgi:hypothetical protein
VRQSRRVCFGKIGSDDWTPYVRTDHRFMRPADVEHLVGDSRTPKRSWHGSRPWSLQTSWSRWWRVTSRSRRPGRRSPDALHGNRPVHQTCRHMPSGDRCIYGHVVVESIKVHWIGRSPDYGLDARRCNVRVVRFVTIGPLTKLGSVRWTCGDLVCVLAYAVPPSAHHSKLVFQLGHRWSDIVDGRTLIVTTGPL